MKVAVCYVAVSGGAQTDFFAARFCTSYQQFPPGSDHDTIILCNGGRLPFETALIFATIPNARFYERANDPGWDISAYIDAASNVVADYDFVLCLGQSIFFNQAGWLNRILNCWSRHGPGMYGPFASNWPRPHLQTTAFLCPPDLLRRWPYAVSGRDHRYQFEHGERCFWKFVATQGKPVRLITWDGCWSPREWRYPHNVLWRGDQSNCLMWSNHTEHYFNATPVIKAFWERFGNGL